MALIEYFLLQPTLTHIVIFSGQIEMQKKQLDQQLQKGLTSKDVRNAYETVQSSLEELQRMHIHSGNELSYITTLEDLADTHRIALSLNLATPATDAIAGDITPAITTMQIEGSYEDIFSYVESLERLSYYLIIDRISLASPSPNENLLQGQIHAYGLLVK